MHTEEPSEVRKGIGSPGTELQMVGAAMCALGTELTVRLLSHLSILSILIVIHYYFVKGKLFIPTKTSSSILNFVLYAFDVVFDSSLILKIFSTHTHTPHTKFHSVTFTICFQMICYKV